MATSLTPTGTTAPFSSPAHRPTPAVQPNLIVKTLPTALQTQLLMAPPASTATSSTRRTTRTRARSSTSSNSRSTLTWARSTTPPRQIWMGAIYSRPATISSRPVRSRRTLAIPLSSSARRTWTTSRPSCWTAIGYRVLRIWPSSGPRVNKT